jgi:hypothetical protein
MKNTLSPAKSPRGRPPGSTINPEKKKKRVNITIDVYHQEIAEKIGNGNLSSGIRVALDFYEKIKNEVTT